MYSGRLPAQVLAQDSRLHVAHHVRHQPLLPRDVLAGHDHAVGDSLAPQQRALDLARLDAETPDLHLRVHPPQELQLAPGRPPHPVARPIEPRPGLAAERVRDETLRRQPRPAQIAARHPHAPHIQLAGDADRRRPAGRVQHVHPHVLQRPADRRGTPVRLAAGSGRADRGLCGPVGIRRRHGPRSTAPPWRRPLPPPHSPPCAAPAGRPAGGWPAPTAAGWPR